MLARNMKVTDIALEHWRRLMLGREARRFARRLVVIHQGGKVRRCVDTHEGRVEAPVAQVEDAQKLAEELLQARPEFAQVQVIDPQAYAAKQAEIRKDYDSSLDIDEWLAKEWDGMQSAEGFAIAPATEYLWYGLPLRRYQKFVDKMLPDSCVFVLGAFDAEGIWTGLLVAFEGRKAVQVSTFDALDQEDLAEVKGRDQHPFLLSMVSNTFKRPAFGWFCDREVLESYLTAPDEASMEEIFQRALMEKKATFDFSVLIQNGITPLAPINPGEAQQDSPRVQVAGADGVEGQRQG